MTIDTRCDTCGKPATSLARDVLRHEIPGEMFARRSPGKLKAGCDDHPARSEERVTQMPPDSAA